MKQYKLLLLTLFASTLFWACPDGATPGQQKHDIIADSGSASGDNGYAGDGDIIPGMDLYYNVEYDLKDEHNAYDSMDRDFHQDIRNDGYAPGDIHDIKDTTVQKTFCFSDLDCPKDRPYCDNGGSYQCVECRGRNQDCPDGSLCMRIYRAGDYSETADIRCMPKVCKNNADCTPYVCNKRSGQCVQCFSDEDCPRSMECTTKGLFCRQRTCDKDSDCPKGLECNRRHRCVECKTLADCPEGLTCYPNGICDVPLCDPTMPRRCVSDNHYIACSSSGDTIVNGMCILGTICVDGYCEKW